MGVLNCNRRGCENIMCDRHSITYGYICDECFEELIRSGFDADPGYFMRSEKIADTKDLAEERFDLEFPLRD